MNAAHQSDWMLAIIAGIMSFFSPCVLPLIPGYLSMVSGLSFEQLETQKKRDQARIFITCLLFALGLCAVFIPMGVAAGLIGNVIAPHKRLLNIIFGLAVIVFGLFMMGVLKLTFLYQDRRFRLHQTSTGMWAAPVMGMAFGAGWTPCIGPWLSLLITRAMNMSPSKAAVLFAVFGAVFGLCFVVAGMLFSHLLRTFSFFRKHYRVIELAGGSLLVIMGGLLVTGWWDTAANWMNGLFE